MTLILLVLSILFIGLAHSLPQITRNQPDVFRGKVCIGTNRKMSMPSYRRGHHYRDLKDRYTNCAYVEGNLELTWIQDKDMDLSFLQHIREVTGYVLISHVDVKRILLPSLRVIRGRNLFRLNVDDEFALMVTLSRMDNLELPALRDVLNGKVGIFNNYNLCHVKTINWDEIISGQKLNTKYVYEYNFTQPERECPPCDPTCEAGCWGEGPGNCQKFSKINCSPQCHEGRCYGLEPNECCHLSCAGGCVGPKNSDCLACKNFFDDGECKDECPSLVIYNPKTYLSEKNPGGKYAYGATCVKTCPDNLLRDDGGACVRQCAPDKEALDGECVPCNGPCRKVCQGPEQATIHSGNIASFENCTIIEGSIAILDTSFIGFQEVYQNFTFGQRHPPMDPSKLEVFSTLKEITGYLNIQARDDNFTNLSYFRNLEIIGGQEKVEYFSSLYIEGTSLKSLSLRSLKKIRSGAVSILDSDNLCFVDTINWTKIMNGKVDEQVLNNSPAATCRKIGAVCSHECSSDGCWGPGLNDCFSCANFQFGDKCIPSCDPELGIYEDSPGICKACPDFKYNNTIGLNGCNSCDQVFPYYILYLITLIFIKKL